MEDENQTPQEELTVSVPLNVLSLALQLVDASSQRGAIRGDELLPIGQLREYLVNTLKRAQEAPAAAPEVTAKKKK